jgi:hypothetical protein
MRAIAPASLLLALSLSLPLPCAAEVVTEPKTGLAFPTRDGKMALFGVGLRTKTFLKFKIYALAFYAEDAALAGPLRSHRGNLDSPAFYHALVTGDFEKQYVLKLVRTVSAEQIRDGFRDYMPPSDPRLLAQFLAYWSDAKAGQECVIHWVPGQGLLTMVNGEAKPVINDKPFSDAVFAVWLGEHVIEDKMRKQLVSRTYELLQ